MTLEEIIAEAKEDENFRKQLVGWAANDTVEGKELLTNFANVEFDKKIGDKVSEIHNGYDNDVFEILGQRKKAEQKSYDFVKEIALELKELRSAKPSDKEAKIKELQDKLKEANDSGSLNEHWKKIYEEALGKWTETENSLKKSIQDKEVEFNSNRIISELKSSLGALKLKEGIPQEAIDAMVKVNEEKILKTAKVIDGKVVFHHEDGSPWMNEEYKPISSNGVIKSFLGAMIDDGASQNKGGGGASTRIENGKIIKTGEGDNAKDKLVLDKASFSTKVEFNKLAEQTLRNQGITADNKNYTKLLDDAYVEYEVSKLELQ